jgi:hypothetical protein
VGERAKAMMQRTIQAPLSTDKVSTTKDPRTVALGTALLAVDAAIIAMREQLKALGIEPDAILDPLWNGYHATSDKVDKALTNRFRR